MHDGGAMFQSSATRILSAFVHFIGVSIVAHCLSRRVAVERLSTVSGLSQLSLARGLLLLILLDSWLFLITGGMVIFGVGLESSDFVCSLGIYLCIVFYSTSKALIYFFLVEKMYIVWAPLAGSQRYRSPIYIFASCILLGYLIIIALLFIGRISRIRADGSCVIGLRNIASIPLIAYDLFTNIILTGLFLYPLWRSTTLKPSIKRIATRTTLAALVALVTSTVNMLILTLMHGEQLGWVCLGACGIDVVVNALTLFWVTTGANHNDGRDRFDDPFPWSSSKAATIVLRSRSRHLSIPRQSPGNSFVSDIGTTVPRDMVWKVDLTPDKPYLPDSAPAAMQDLSPIRGRASISGLSDTRRSGVRSYP